MLQVDRLLNTASMKTSSHVAMVMTSSWFWVLVTVGWRLVDVWRESRDLSRCCKIRATWECYTDVLHTLSALCSGKSECTLQVIHVSDLTDSAMPCYDNLKMYLEVAYICVSGMRLMLFESCWMHIFMLRCLSELLWVIQVFVMCDRVNIKLGTI